VAVDFGLYILDSGEGWPKYGACVHGRSGANGREWMNGYISE
jgi:hypothetical protein